MVLLPYSRGRSIRYFNWLQDLSATIRKKDVYVNGFFPLSARLWNSLPVKCFPLNHDLNGFKSRVNRHLLS